MKKNALKMKISHKKKIKISRIIRILKINKNENK